MIATAVTITGISLLSVEPVTMPDVGERIRVTHHCRWERDQCIHSALRSSDSGSLIAFDAGSLVLARDTGGDDVVLPLASVDRLWVADGTRNNAIAGAFAVGVAGVVLGSAVPVSEVGWLLGGSMGALLGAAIGAQVKTTRWVEVPIEDVAVSRRGTRPRRSLP